MLRNLISFLLPPVIEGPFRTWASCLFAQKIRRGDIKMGNFRTMCIWHTIFPERSPIDAFMSLADMHTASLTNMPRQDHYA